MAKVPHGRTSNAGVPRFSPLRLAFAVTWRGVRRSVAHRTPSDTAIRPGCGEPRQLCELNKTTKLLLLSLLSVCLNVFAALRSC